MLVGVNSLLLIYYYDDDDGDHRIISGIISIMSGLNFIIPYYTSMWHGTSINDIDIYWYLLVSIIDGPSPG